MHIVSLAQRGKADTGILSFPFLAPSTPPPWTGLPVPYFEGYEDIPKAGITVAPGSVVLPKELASPSPAAASSSASSSAYPGTAAKPITSQEMDKNLNLFQALGSGASVLNGPSIHSLLFPFQAGGCFANQY
jgi:hypothetical protein